MVRLPKKGKYSGKFVLRLPKVTHQLASEYAHKNGTSLNQYILAAIGVQIGHDKAREKFLSDKKKGKYAKLMEETDE